MYNWSCTVKHRNSTCKNKSTPLETVEELVNFSDSFSPKPLKPNHYYEMWMKGNNNFIGGVTDVLWPQTVRWLFKPGLHSPRSPPWPSHSAELWSPGLLTHATSQTSVSKVTAFVCFAFSWWAQSLSPASVALVLPKAFPAAAASSPIDHIQGLLRCSQLLLCSSSQVQPHGHPCPLSSAHSPVPPPSLPSTTQLYSGQAAWSLLIPFGLQGATLTTTGEKSDFCIYAYLSTEIDIQITSTMWCKKRGCTHILSN